MVIADFVCITMKAKSGKTLYLACGETEKSMVWTTNKNECCAFDTDTQAEKFAKQYFKNFTGWSLQDYIITDKNM